MPEGTIISAHGSRWSDTPQITVPHGSSVVYYIQDDGILSNHDGYQILEQLQQGHTPGGHVVQTISAGEQTYDYECWYAPEFAAHCGIYHVGSSARIAAIPAHPNSLKLSDIFAHYPNSTIYWVCCREVTPRGASPALRHSPGAFLSAPPPEPSAPSADSIPWNDKTGGEAVFNAIQAKQTFTVTVAEPQQVTAWEKVLSKKETENGGDSITPQTLSEAVLITAIIAFTGLIAYAISRGYGVNARRTRTTMSFEFDPRQEVSYAMSGIYTSSNSPHDLSLDAILTDKSGNKLGSFQIIRCN